MGETKYVFKLEDVETKTIHGGSVISHIILHEQSCGVKNFSLLHNTMKAGLNCAHDTPGHFHEEEHCMYILSGKGGISIDGTRYNLEPDMTVFVPPGAVHYVWADKQQDMKYIIIYSPPGPEKKL